MSDTETAAPVSSPPPVEAKTITNAGAATSSAVASGVISGTALEETPDTSIASSIPAIESSTNTSSESSAEATPKFEGEDIYDAILRFTNFSFLESTIFSDGSSRKIDCFIVDKSVMDRSGCLHYIYGREVTSINITQSMSSYGISASVDIIDTFGTISSIIEKQSNFYFVIAIFDVVNEDKNGKVEGYTIQPYIFEIDNVTLKSSDGKPSKIYHLKLSDIISGTLKRVGYGNLLLQYPGFVNSQHFGEIYSTIFDYASQIIYFSHNKKFYLENNIEYLDDINESNNEFIKSVILKDLDFKMSCYDLLNYIYKHAAREIKIPAHFSGDNPGNVLIPLFVQDEIEDLNNRYRRFFNKKVKKKIVDDALFTEGPFKVSGHLIRRSLYAKNLLMPFELAFKSESPSYIYENINPLVDEKSNLLESENIYKPLNGIVFSPLEDTVDIPPPGELVGLGWKNLALLSDTPSGSNNLLIYFNWIYEFYKAAFLNDKNSFLKTELLSFISPVVDPHFHKMETLNLTGGDEETFAKMNANTIVLKSTDPIKEALYHVGRALKSFIFLSSLSGFKIKGNTARHPGEIIKINSPVQTLEDEAPVSTIGGLDSAASGFVLMYVSSVSHIFDGNKFNDLIYATKICTINGKEYQQYISDKKAGDSQASSL
ncbi:MAG: hypothetical protein IJ341_12550 [Bacteroidales bacterium]|nr:hypothetical protein [Bacteroidales bacterium]